MHERDALHALTWAWWALAGLVTLQLAPNPAYVAVVVAIAALVVETHGQDGPLGRAFPVLVAVGVVFAGVRVVLTGLTFHGDGTTLFTLPALTLPTILGGFTVGGPIVGEVVLRSAAEGLVIVGVVAVFGAFNAVVSHHQLVRSAPRAFHELGLVVTVGLAFVPSTIAAIRATTESDRARTGGRVVRRGRILRMVVPVLEGGMERAMDLAASMDARGFAHGGASRRERRAGWLALAGLITLAGAFAALVGRARPVAAGLGLVGVVAVLGAIAVVSHASRRPRYRQRRPGLRDLAVAGIATIAPATVAVLSATGEPSLRWVAGTGWPELDTVVVLALLALVTPAVGGGLARRADPVAEVRP